MYEELLVTNTNSQYCLIKFPGYLYDGYDALLLTEVHFIYWSCKHLSKPLTLQSNIVHLYLNALNRGKKKKSAEIFAIGSDFFKLCTSYLFMQISSIVFKVISILFFVLFNLFLPLLSVVAYCSDCQFLFHPPSPQVKWSFTPHFQISWIILKFTSLK